MNFISVGLRLEGLHVLIAMVVVFRKTVAQIGFRPVQWTAVTHGSHFTLS